MKFVICCAAVLFGVVEAPPRRSSRGKITRSVRSGTLDARIEALTARMTVFAGHVEALASRQRELDRRVTELERGHRRIRVLEHRVEELERDRHIMIWLIEQSRAIDMVRLVGEFSEEVEEGERLRVLRTGAVGRQSSGEWL